MAEPLGVSVDDGVCVSLALCVALGEIVPDGVSEVDGVEVMLPLWVCEADGVREELCVGDGVVDTDADSDGDCVAVPGQVRRTEREGGDAWTHLLRRHTHLITSARAFATTTQSASRSETRFP